MFLVNDGRIVYEVQQILGHSDPKVAMHNATEESGRQTHIMSLRISGAIEFSVYSISKNLTFL